MVGSSTYSTIFPRKREFVYFLLWSRMVVVSHIQRYHFQEREFVYFLLWSRMVYHYLERFILYVGGSIIYSTISFPRESYSYRVSQNTDCTSSFSLSIQNRKRLATSLRILNVGNSIFFIQMIMRNIFW